MKKLLLSIIAVLSLQIAQAQQLQTQNPLGIKIVSTGNYFISSAQIAELCVGENLEVIVHSTIVNNYQYNISGPATIPSQISQTSVTFNFPIAGVYQIWIEIPPYPNPPTPPTSAVFTILVTDSPIIFNNINIPSLFCEDGLSTDLSTYISVTPVNSTLSYTCSTLVISLNGVFQNNQIGSHNITITAGSNGCESTIQHHIDIIAKERIVKIK